MHPKVAQLIAKAYVKQGTQEWLDLREGKLTASDMATAIGENPYEKPRDLILKKCGLKPFTGNSATAWGTKWEDVARDIYCERHDEVAHEIGLEPHPTIDWLAGSPDGVTESGKLIEIKCPMSRAIVPGEVPGHYVAQIQLLMEILDLDECDFIQYKPDELTWPAPAEFDVVNVKRDRAWFAEKRPIAHEVWKRVLWHRENGCDGIAPKKRAPRAKKDPVVVDLDSPVACEID